MLSEVWNAQVQVQWLRAVSTEVSIGAVQLKACATETCV